MWKLKFAIRLLENLTRQYQTHMAALNIDDDVALALRLLRKAQGVVDKAR